MYSLNAASKKLLVVEFSSTSSNNVFCVVGAARTDILTIRLRLLEEEEEEDLEELDAFVVDFVTNLAALDFFITTPSGPTLLACLQGFA